MNKDNINKTIQLGKINLLKINRFTQPGAYLEALDDEVVLLPRCYITEDMKEGDLLEVFIYTDSEDRIVATTQEPYALKDQFMCTYVEDILPFGAFVQWGLSKDLFVPKNKQKTPFEVGQKRIVRVVEDEKTNRLIGIEKITSFLSSDTKKFKRNDKVELLIFAKTPLGYKAIIDNSYEGMLYNTEIFTDVKVGDKLDGYIKNIRDDNKIDLSLQPIGKTNTINHNCNKILEILEQNFNELPYTYKSDVNNIKELFGISKKAYKLALTTLIENKQIKLDDKSIQKI
jgi:predicted RNA-binding protein (virulence factor B family)